MRVVRFSILLLLQVVQGFKWMAKLKMPSLVNLRNKFKGSKFGNKKLVVITGTSSGLGKATSKALLKTNEYHVIGAVRDVEKMKLVAKEEGFDMNYFTPMHLDLANFASVTSFVEQLDTFRGDRPIDRLACNAATYQPTLKDPKWTPDGHEQQLQVNFLSHFLLTSKIMPMMKDSEDPRICMIGSPLTKKDSKDVTAGNGDMYPIADLKELQGLELGCRKPVAMIDGLKFNGAKAYKDTKLALAMTSNMLHERFHRSTDIAFSSIYPGCIADSPLFQEKREWFKKYFPTFLKQLSEGFISEEEAGQRLFQVIHDLRCRKSGVFWGLNGGEGAASTGLDSIVEKDQSAAVLNKDAMMKLWRCATEVTGADWPPAYQPKSPCPTLKVVGAATSVLGVLEEQSRMKASREGSNAQIVSDKSLPKEERRRALEQMLSVLDQTPTDPLDLEYDLLRTSGQSPASIAVEMQKREAQLQAREAAAVAALDREAAGPSEAQMQVMREVGKGLLSRLRRNSEANVKKTDDEDLQAALANTLGEPSATGEVALPSHSSQENKDSTFSAVVPEIDDPIPAAPVEEKGPPKMIEGHELLGDIPVVFQPQNIMTMARIGQPLSEVASQADVFIRYKCRKGECKTCVVNIDSKWVSACQTKIPPVAPGQFFEVHVKPVANSERSGDKAVFFSPKSLAQGAMNNALGMVGFVRDGLEADPDFKLRMEKERLIDEIAKKKREKEAVKAK
eukprot:gnl/MRDRNA2_/MRDRNA2_89823_c0_seq1.p1 gnl/MRDRNA2_/MRDRNA2_89823_c0~~gnl/MRDRNA2_/MRDRNA2_89823_c0_seq1.p1  ORF type:complete len:733 (+),score=184.98 gnl/MRDRNA2_/MRDRNA2_89823_c0_seq1:79-2277(+)